MINIGIIGMGFMGRQHLEAIRRIPGLRVAAVCEPGRGQAVAQELEVPQGFSDYRELLKVEELDAVHNCTPNGAHYEIIKAALSAGKHVYQEKPMTVTAAQAWELEALRRRSGVAGAINHQYRLNAAVQWMRYKVRGEAGRVFMVRGQYLQQSNVRAEDYMPNRMDETLNGPLRAAADIGVHWLDAAECVMGQPITAVYACLQTIHPRRIDGQGLIHAMTSDDQGTILVGFQDGTPGSFVVSKVAHGHMNDLQLTVDSQAHSMTWRQEAPDRLWIGRRGEVCGEIGVGTGWLPPELAGYAHLPQGHVGGYPEGLKNAIAQFYRSVQTGAWQTGDYPYADFKQGAHLMDLMEAIQKSRETGTWIALA